MHPKILCISLGSIGRRHLKNVRKLLPDAQIAIYRQHNRNDKTVVDGANFIFSSMEQAQAFAPDAVIISSPASEHISNATAFVKQNIPLFIEKPLAVSADGIDSFVRQCQVSSGFIMVGYVLRFLPALHTIKKLIASGALGEVLTAHIQVGQYLPDWRPGTDYRQGVSAQSKLGGGALLELSHEIDYATWLFGWPQTLQCSRAKLSKLEIDVEDSANILLEYNNKRVSIQLDLLQRVANMEIQIVGSNSTLKANLIKEEIVLFSPEHQNGKQWECEKLPDGNDIYLRQFDFLFKQSLTGYNPIYSSTQNFVDWASIDHSVHVLQLVDLAKKASDTGVRQNVSFAK